MGLRLVLVLACVVLPVSLAACGSDSGLSTEIFQSDSYPFTFEYPGSFQVTNDVSVDQSLGAATQNNAAVALDENNGIILETATLNAQVTADNLDLAKRQFDALVGKVDPGASGKPGKTGGFPSLSYAALPVSTVQDGESTITFLFDGDQEYVINCQSTPDHRDEVNSACDQALQTLKRS